MTKRIKTIIRKYYHIVSYLVFGVLTTAVNYIVYLPCYNLLKFPAVISNMIAWVVAVAFAYSTNKPFVFKSFDWSIKTVIPELMKFIGTRVASGALESVIILISVDVLGWNGNVWKLVTSVLVVVMNYIGSKLLVFRNK